MNKVKKLDSVGVTVNRKDRNRNKKLCHSSKQLCQEKLACHGQPPAKYRCEECETLQCESCENLLHETAKFLFHDRVVLTPPPSELLCQEICVDRNFADVYCESCNKNLCFLCEEVTHGTRRKSHRRVPFELPTPDTAGNLNDLDEFYSSHWTNSDEVSEIEISPATSSVVSTEVSCDSIYTRNSLYDVEGVAPLCMEPQNIMSDKNEKKKKNSFDNQKSFILVDDKEQLKICSEVELIEKLQCSALTSIKVVSIFGNTGEGKSHTLNHTFFGGQEVFHTSQAQASCTIGVWIAYNKNLNVVTIDTEGLLGFTSNENQRIRLLLKVRGK